jgi:hypothetical protein
MIYTLEYLSLTQNSTLLVDFGLWECSVYNPSYLSLSSTPLFSEQAKKEFD